MEQISIQFHVCCWIYFFVPGKNIQSQENCVKFGDYNEIIAIEMWLPSVMSAASQLRISVAMCRCNKNDGIAHRKFGKLKEIVLHTFVCVCFVFLFNFMLPSISSSSSADWTTHNYYFIFNSMSTKFFDTWPRDEKKTKNFRLVNYPWIILPIGNVIAFYSFLFSFYFCRQTNLAAWGFLFFFFVSSALACIHRAHDLNSVRKGSNK